MNHPLTGVTGRPTQKREDVGEQAVFYAAANAWSVMRLSYVLLLLQLLPQRRIAP